MNFHRARRLSGAVQRQADRKNCAHAFGALAMDFAAVQFHATLGNHQPEPAARHLTDILPAMKRREQLLAIAGRNADAMIRHAEYRGPVLNF